MKFARQRNGYLPSSPGCLISAGHEPPRTSFVAAACAGQHSDFEPDVGHGLASVGSCADVPRILERSTYGTWLALLSYLTLQSALDYGFQDYLEAEAMRLGLRDRVAYRMLFWSSMPVSAALGALKVLVSVGVAFTGFKASFLAGPVRLKRVWPS